MHGECPPVTCRMYCVDGWAQDSNGCDICVCAEPPAQDPVEKVEEPLEEGSEECLPVTCRMYCADGWAQDSQGCDICVCS